MAANMNIAKEITFDSTSNEVLLSLTEGNLDRITLTSQFPSAVGLKFSTNGLWKGVAATEQIEVGSLIC